MMPKELHVRKNMLSNSSDMGIALRVRNPHLRSDGSMYGLQVYECCSGGHLHHAHGAGSDFFSVEYDFKETRIVKRYRDVRSREIYEVSVAGIRGEVGLPSVALFQKETAYASRQSKKISLDTGTRGSYARISARPRFQHFALSAERSPSVTRTLPP